MTSNTTVKSEESNDFKLPLASIEPFLAIKDLLAKRSPFPEIASLEGHGRIVTDSRKLRKDDCFLAYNGVSGDAHAFIPTAIAKGAGLLVVEDPTFIPDDCKIPWVHVKSGRAAWSWLMAEAHNNPQDKLTLLGVTGTNGKSSTVWMAGRLLAAVGTPTMTIGTLGAYIYNGEHVEHIPTTHTTPDPDQLYRLFAIAVEKGVQALVMEVSSHSIIQEKLVPLAFSACAFTSFTRDHLDFHGTMEAYFDAKWRLFTDLATSNARMIFSSGIEHDLELSSLSSDTWVYGPDVQNKAKAWRCANKLSFTVKKVDIFGSDLELSFVTAKKTGSKKATGHVVYFGQHAIENFCAALLLVESAAGKAVSTKYWSQLLPVPGRLETVAVKHQPMCIVDYAHTPDALEKTLTVLRPYCKGSLWVVFGCGGERDHGKRPQMAAVAEQFADHVIVTSDNPRAEDPLNIITEIRSGFKKALHVTIEPDREKAIAEAIKAANPDDTVVIAGKGHEAYQTVGKTTLPFDDRKTALKYLRS